MQIEQVIQYARPNILRLKPYASARSEFKGTASIWLDANENPWETDKNRYPDPLQQRLKAKIASLKQLAPQQIFLGNGSDEAIDLLFRIFTRPEKDTAIILPPTYGMYQVSADIHDVEVQKIPLNEDFSLNLSQIKEAAKPSAKLLFVCNPNNPTGNIHKLTEIEQILQTFEGIVVVDEAYIDFAAQASACSLLSQYPNLVVLQTFSKAWGLAGIRLGMAFAHPSLIKLFNKVKPPYNINVLTQQVALRALDQVKKVNTQIKQLNTERQRLAQALQNLPCIEKVYPSASNFLLCKVHDAEQLYLYLINNKIVVRNRSKQLHCARCLRFTVGRPEENTQLLEKIAAYSMAKTV